MRSRFLLVLLLAPTFLLAQAASNQPVHYQAVYTRIYADGVEAGKTGNIGPGLELQASVSAGRESYYARIPIEVRDANIEGIELTLQPMPDIHGHVILENNLKGAKPRLSLHSTINQLVHLKDDLTFNFDSLPPGSYELGPQIVSSMCPFGAVGNSLLQRPFPLGDSGE